MAATATTPTTTTPAPERRARALLDHAVRVLVASPGASLAEVAEAAGIGRTTLHKHFPTRDDLVRAVGLRAVSRWEQAVDAVADGPAGGLRELMTAAIECGPELQFIWRSPTLDADDELIRRYNVVEKKSLAVINRAQALGVITMSGTPDWWLLQSFYALSYTAFEMVHSGHLAPLDAPGLALNTLLHGVGATSPKSDSQHI
jgi:AcrR family transcriptional regulator